MSGFGWLLDRYPKAATKRQDRARRVWEAMGAEEQEWVLGLLEGYKARVAGWDLRRIPDLSRWLRYAHAEWEVRSTAEYDMARIEGAFKRRDFDGGIK